MTPPTESYCSPLRSENPHAAPCFTDKSKPARVRQWNRFTKNQTTTIHVHKRVNARTVGEIQLQTERNWASTTCSFALESRNRSYSGEGNDVASRQCTGIASSVYCRATLSFATKVRP